VCYVILYLADKNAGVHIGNSVSITDLPCWYASSNDRYGQIMVTYTI